MKRIATITLFTILISSMASGQSKPKDVLGWERTRWGMTAEEIAKLFGSRADRVPSVEGYGDWYYLYTVAANLQGQTYTAIFLMDRSTDKLARVDVRLNEYESQKPQRDIFDALNSMLGAQYGAPDATKEDPSSEEGHDSHARKF